MDGQKASNPPDETQMEVAMNLVLMAVNPSLPPSDATNSSVATAPLAQGSSHCPHHMRMGGVSGSAVYRNTSQVQSYDATTGVGTWDNQRMENQQQFPRNAAFKNPPTMSNTPPNTNATLQHWYEHRWNAGMMKPPMISNIPHHANATGQHWYGQPPPYAEMSHAPIMSHNPPNSNVTRQPGNEQPPQLPEMQNPPMMSHKSHNVNGTRQPEHEQPPQQPEMKTPPVMSHNPHHVNATRQPENEQPPQQSEKQNPPLMSHNPHTVNGTRQPEHGQPPQRSEMKDPPMTSHKSHNVNSTGEPVHDQSPQQSETKNQPMMSHKPHNANGTWEPVHEQPPLPSEMKNLSTMSHNPPNANVTRQPGNEQPHQQSEKQNQPLTSHNPHNVNGTRQPEHEQPPQQPEMKKSPLMSHNPHHANATRQPGKEQPPQQSEKQNPPLMSHNPHTVNGTRQPKHEQPPLHSEMKKSPMMSHNSHHVNASRQPGNEQPPQRAAMKTSHTMSDTRDNANVPRQHGCPHWNNVTMDSDVSNPGEVGDQWAARHPGMEIADVSPSQGDASNQEGREDTDRALEPDVLEDGLQDGQDSRRPVTKHRRREVVTRQALQRRVTRTQMATTGVVTRTTTRRQTRSSSTAKKALTKNAARVKRQDQDSQSVRSAANADAAGQSRKGKASFPSLKDTMSCKEPLFSQGRQPSPEEQPVEKAPPATRKPQLGAKEAPQETEKKAQPSQELSDRQLPAMGNGAKKLPPQKQPAMKLRVNACPRAVRSNGPPMEPHGKQSQPWGLPKKKPTPVEPVARMLRKKRRREYNVDQCFNDALRHHASAQRLSDYGLPGVTKVVVVVGRKRIGEVSLIHQTHDEVVSSDISSSGDQKSASPNQHPVGPGKRLQTGIKAFQPNSDNNKSEIKRDSDAAHLEERCETPISPSALAPYAEADIDLPCIPKDCRGRWKYDTKQRVFRGDFSHLNRHEIPEVDRSFLGSLMSRPDVTVITKGVLDPMFAVDQSLLDTLSCELGKRPYHKFRAFRREDSGNHKELMGFRSMMMDDFVRYLRCKEEINKGNDNVDPLFRYTDATKKEHELNLYRMSLYLIDCDMPKLLPEMYEDYISNFKLPEILPGGKLCMLNAMNAEARPFMGPNLYVNPGGGFTSLHQDGHGTVDSGHTCLSGYNEVVMLRRLPDIHKKRAASILQYDAVYQLPHDSAMEYEGIWPSHGTIEEWKAMNYYPTVFVLEPGEHVHINKGRLHMFRKLTSITLPEEDCHFSLRQAVLRSKHFASNTLCISIAYDWMYLGSSKGSMYDEINTSLEAVSLVRAAGKATLGIPETALLRLSNRLAGGMTRFGQCNRLLGPLFTDLCEAVQPHLDRVIEREKRLFESTGNVRQEPDSHHDPSTYGIDPNGSDYFCKLCFTELANSYFHCMGCEELLDKDFNVCTSCWQEGRQFITMRMGSYQTLLCDRHHTGSRPKRGFGRNCTCKQGVCAKCRLCRSCSCKCHHKFRLHTRFFTLDDLLEIQMKLKNLAPVCSKLQASVQVASEVSNETDQAAIKEERLGDENIGLEVVQATSGNSVGKESLPSGTLPRLSGEGSQKHTPPHHVPPKSPTCMKSPPSYTFSDSDARGNLGTDRSRAESQKLTHAEKRKRFYVMEPNDEEGEESLYKSVTIEKRMLAAAAKS